MAKAALALAALLVGACASTSNYVGRPVSEVFLEMGPPTGSVTMADGNKAYQWRQGRTVGMVLPSGIMAARERDCVITMVVNTADTVLERRASSRC